VATSQPAQPGQFADDPGGAPVHSGIEDVAGDAVDGVPLGNWVTGSDVWFCAMQVGLPEAG